LGISIRDAKLNRDVGTFVDHPERLQQMEKALEHGITREGENFLMEVGRQ
jgi:hypothetical protein